MRCLLGKIQVRELAACAQASKFPNFHELQALQLRQGQEEAFMACVQLEQENIHGAVSNLDKFPNLVPGVMFPWSAMTQDEMILIKKINMQFHGDGMHCLLIETYYRNTTER